MRQRPNCLEATPPPSARVIGAGAYHLPLTLLRVRSVPTISARAHAAATAVGFSRLALHVRLGTYTYYGVADYGHGYYG